MKKIFAILVCFVAFAATPFDMAAKDETLAAIEQVMNAQLPMQIDNEITLTDFKFDDSRNMVLTFKSNIPEMTPELMQMPGAEQEFKKAFLEGLKSGGEEMIEVMKMLSCPGLKIVLYNGAGQYCATLSFKASEL